MDRGHSIRGHSIRGRKRKRENDNISSNMKQEECNINGVLRRLCPYTRYELNTYNKANNTLCKKNFCF